MRKNPNRGSGIRDEHPHHNFIFESIVSVFWVKDTVLKFFDAVPYPGSEILSTLDPGPGMFILCLIQKLFIPDPQHWLYVKETLFSTQSEVPSLIRYSACQLQYTQNKCLQYIRWYSVKPTLYKLPITVEVFTLYSMVQYCIQYIIQYRTELEHAEYIQYTHTYAGI
jgi:hypothetical protein